MFPFHCFMFEQEYSALFEGAGNNPGDKTLEDKFFEHEASIFITLYKNTYMQTLIMHLILIIKCYINNEIFLLFGIHRFV